eukprot:gene10050-7942_t
MKASLVNLGPSSRASQRPPAASPSRPSVRCNSILSWVQEQIPGGSGFKERPLYRPGEMLPLGDMKVSPMGMGTWAWGNQFLWGYDESMDAELQEVFNLAVSSGINLFDTADSYGTGKLNGKSEILLGKFIAEYPGSEKFAAYPWRVFPSSMVGAAKESLKRTGLEQLSVGQLHWSASNYAPLQELAMWNGMADCYEQGLVRAVGVSNYGPKELRAVHKKLASRGVPLASAQIQYSLLSRGREQLETKDVCKYSMDKLPAGPRGVLFKQILPELAPLLSTLEAVAKSRNKTVPQVAINWCMAKGTVPIPGAKDLKQVAIDWCMAKGTVPIPGAKDLQQVSVWRSMLAVKGELG